VSQPISLRERKRAETWSALHAAASETALEKGLEHVGVDAVAAAAGVSTRTFFHYFPTKEDAVLGLQEPCVDESMLANFDVEGDLLQQVSYLMLSVLQSIQGGQSGEIRHAILHKYPHLAHRRFQYVVKVEQLVTDIVTEQLAASQRWAARKDEPYTVEEVAKTTVMVAGAGLRNVMQKTISRPTRESQFEALDEGLHLMRSVLKELL
jgi:AcrR family transcriptional regulator